MTSLLQRGHGYAKSQAMPTDAEKPAPQPPLPGNDADEGRAGRRRLSPEAERALAEAAARRAGREPAAATPPKEVGGPAGPEPTRYGDWEKDGIASDF